MKKLTLDSQADSNTSAVFRTGVAARMAGLPVETLRVWERRYQLSCAARSPQGQRLYSAEQVRRLSLLKQLSDQGHAIGTLAELSIAQLQAMIQAPQHQANRPLSVVVIGATIAARLTDNGHDASPPGSFYGDASIKLSGACQRQQDVASLPRHADVLIMEISELDVDALARIQQARNETQAKAALVLYRFCASSTIRQLRAQGCAVARVPADLQELLPLIRLASAHAPRPHLVAPDMPPIEFNDETLAKIMALRNPVACECPRHLAELLMMVGSFERYSAQCAWRNDADAALHVSLQQAASQARLILETAMDDLLRSEGMWPVPD